MNIRHAILGSGECWQAKETTTHVRTQAVRAKWGHYVRGTILLIGCVALSFFALGIAGPSYKRANAADLLDAWINVFSFSEFDISSVVNTTNTTNTGVNYAQTIEGTHKGRRLRFYIQRSTVGFNVLFSEKAVARSFRIDRSDASNFRKIKVRGGRGASVDHRGCRLIQSGLYGNAHNSDGFEFVIFSSTCGDGDQLAAFLAKVRPATRESNSADLALYKPASQSRQPTSAKIDSDRGVGGYTGFVQPFTGG